MSSKTHLTFSVQVILIKRFLVAVMWYNSIDLAIRGEKRANKNGRSETSWHRSERFLQTFAIIILAQGLANDIN